MSKRMVHVELPAKDPDRAQRFWEGVGGWDIQREQMPGIDYRMFREGDQGGAVFPRDEQGPILYFDSDNLDADLLKVTELGGEAADKQPIPGVGWFARCKDSEGNPFSLF